MKLEHPSAELNRSQPTRTIRVAMLGNPNTGKSTLFNRLTGIRQHTANYPRVTYEHRSGSLIHDQVAMEIIDLPGTYSLAPRSPEEIITVNVLLGAPPASAAPDVILCVVDASNLERNLFLVSQILDLNQPTVLAVNMLDVAERQGMTIDLEALSKKLGVPAIGVQAHKGIGLVELRSALARTFKCKPFIGHDPFPPHWKSEIQKLASVARASPAGGSLTSDAARFLAIRSLFDTDGSLRNQTLPMLDSHWVEDVRLIQNELQQSEINLAEAESQLRFSWIEQQLSSVVRESVARPVSWTNQVDRWLTHPLWGLLVVFVVMTAAFQAVFTIAEPASIGIDYFKLHLSSLVNSILSEGALHSLINDGLINGVGGVLVFLPQIVLLFFILAALEDSGYLARAAYLVDRYFSKFGLSGITLFPLLSSFACAIPGIMATRVIPDPKERMITILIAPLMSCSARLPVYVLMIAAFVPDTTFLGGWLGLQGMVMMCMYLLGIVVAIGVAWILKNFVFKSRSSAFLLELPTYKIPRLKNIFRRMFDGGWAFVRGAGTIIVAVTILVWAASYFPRAGELPPELMARKAAMILELEKLEAVGDDVSEDTLAAREELESQIGGVEASFQLRQSFLGRAGLAIEPIVKPLGWDWRIGSAAIASFPAREVVVATLGVIFGLGSELDEESTLLRQGLEQATWDGTDKKLFTLPVALSLMVFFALCAQCASTLAVIRRETNSWLWPTVTFTYMTVLAYVGAFLTFQTANWIMG
jgi:ferrous iron transport protein B